MTTSQKDDDFSSKPVLVTGATGYVGGRLVPKLLAGGHRVRAMGRSMRKLRGKTWANHPRVELVRADFQSPDLAQLSEAIDGCSSAYYLVHSMSPEYRDFPHADRQAVRHFIRAADRVNLNRIIYLGGLGMDSPELSSHLKSRAEVGRILRSGPISTTILRSAIILGSGSASFEILRYLSERLPLMLIPPSVLNTEIQPICIRDVLTYLESCLGNDETIGKIFDIGGPDVLTYRQLFNLYAKETGLGTPLFITPGFLSDSVTGRRIAFTIARMVLPVSPAIAEPLLQGASNRAVVMDDRITKMIPLNLMTCSEAIRRAIQKDSLRIVETRWSDAGQLKPPEWTQPDDAPYAGGPLLKGGFRLTLDAMSKDVWPVIIRLGGKNGWYYGNFLWRIRGWMDNLAGGVGLRRGRRHPEQLLVGDALDFWRVLMVKPPRRLILLAEMKLPGEAILDIELDDTRSGQTEIRLSTRFRSKGLYGLFYWYTLLPFHDLLFGGMLRAIAKKVGQDIISGPKKFKPGPIVL